MSSGRYCSNIRLDELADQLPTRLELAAVPVSHWRSSAIDQLQKDDLFYSQADLGPLMMEA